MSALDAAGVGAEPRRYRAIAAGLEQLGVDVELGRLFQVDMLKATPRAVLGGAVVKELQRGVELLHKTTARRESPELDLFRDRFAERYEGRELPLAEALDVDVGIGLSEEATVEAAPLLQGLPLRDRVEETVGWGDRERFLLHKLGESLEQGRRTISLGQDDLVELAVAEPPPLPGAFGVSAVLAATSDEALGRGEFRLLLEHVWGPSGARLLGRFAHGDRELCGHVRDHLREEEALDSGAVFAEIVHLPEARIGNIIGRPLLRDYEIPYLGRSGASPDRQIPVDDLMVSVAGGRIVLRSRRLARRVVPRLTSAHNYAWQSVPIYRFLCMLQAHNVAGEPRWDWGPLAAAPFLPRVEAGRLVLSLARWRLAKQELRQLAAREPHERFRAIQRIRERRSLPRLIALEDRDNVLPLDLNNVLSIEAFAQLVNDRDEATLVELWPEPEQLCLRGPEGRFKHQLVVPFVRTEPVPAPATRVAAAPATERTLAPGSAWVYAKLYTGPAAADRILLEVVAPLVDELLASGAADRWFFIRYRDPDHHIRLRLRGNVRGQLEVALEPMISVGWLWRLTFDTYERELERYGGPDSISFAERMFQIDSETVLGLLSMLEPGDGGAQERWRIGLCGASALLADFGLDEAGRIALLRDLRESFGREFTVNGELRRRLAERLREQRPALEPLLEPGEDAPRDLAPGIELLRTRSERLHPVMAELHALEAQGRISQTRAELAASFMHMHLNRLLRSAQRAHELVVYDFLLRLYESRAAQGATQRR